MAGQSLYGRVQCGPANAIEVVASGWDNAASSLPSDLNNFAFLHQDGYGSLAAGEGQQTRARCGVSLNVMLDKFAALPFQPLPHLLRVGAIRGSEELKSGHDAVPPASRE